MPSPGARQSASAARRGSHTLCEFARIGPICTRRSQTPLSAADFASIVLFVSMGKGSILHLDVQIFNLYAGMQIFNSTSASLAPRQLRPTSSNGLPMNPIPSLFRSYCLMLAVAIGAWFCPQVPAQSDFERPPIDYRNAEVHDPVAQLGAKIESGELKLEYDAKNGYLASVLKALDIPISSQTLVFSKTSLQLHRISPRRPRAIYFNDDVYVGFCQHGDVLEFASTDPMQGATFYTLRQDDDSAPKFVRDRGQCLSCHASSRTQNVPGYLIRSVFADRGGQPIFGSGTFTSDHTSPMKERWGGWYVTGKHGRMRHMGNTFFDQDDTHDADRDPGANLESLDQIVSTDAYLSPHSDLIALMVMEHQTQMHNALTAANFETRQALHQSFQMNELLEREPGYISESAERRINASADRVLKYLLMCDEFQLEDPVSGTSGFAEDFRAAGIKDSRGRSLRDLDLKTRLFRYPCSYLIYNAAFDALPDEVRGRVVVRLTDILEGRDDSPQYAHLSSSMRREILEILRDTQRDFRSLATVAALR